MEKMYANLIKNGRKNIDDVPEELRASVMELLGISVTETIEEDTEEAV